MTITLTHFLLLGTLLFSLGLYGILAKKNFVAVLLCLEILFSGLNISLVSFSYFTNTIEGQVFMLFVMAIVAAETAMALALILLLNKHYKTTSLDSFSKLRE